MMAVPDTGRVNRKTKFPKKKSKKTHTHGLIGKILPFPGKKTRENMKFAIMPISRYF
jgi:hypothetical protein